MIDISKLAINYKKTKRKVVTAMDAQILSQKEEIEGISFFTSYMANKLLNESVAKLNVPSDLRI